MTTIHVAVSSSTAERVAKMSPGTGRGGRGSAYVRALLEQRESEVRGALRVLESAGWDRHHIRQACGALDGAQHTHEVFGGGLWSGLGLAVRDAIVAPDGTVSGRPTYRALLELHDAARLGRIEVDADRWGAMLDALTARPELVLAIQILARDYWTCEAGEHPEIDDGQAG